MLIIPYYVYDPVTGEYRGEVPFVRKDGASPPDNTTQLSPRIGPGQAAVWNFQSGAWGYVEDRRGTKLWRKDNYTVEGTQTGLGAIGSGWTDIPPLPTKPGCVVRWGVDNWEYVNDSRGLQGWINGVPTEITAIGPLPNNFTTIPPCPPAPSPPPDTRTPEEKRRAAYRKQVDPLVSQAVGYEKEADAWQARGEIEKSEGADAKAQALLEQILLQKEAIRELYPEETK